MEPIYSQATKIFEDGKVAAQSYSSNFFKLGMVCHSLRREVPVADETVDMRPLWTLLAPAGETSMLRWLANEYNVPQTSLSSASSIATFYNGSLGWTLERMASVGRGKLQAALEWLRTCYAHNKLDMHLVNLLEDAESTVDAVQVYCATANTRLFELGNDVKRVHLNGNVNGLAANPVPDAEYNSDTDTFDLEKPARVKPSKRQFRQPSPESIQALDALLPELEAQGVTAPSEPLVVAALSADSLAVVIWRNLQGVFYRLLKDRLDDETYSTVAEELQEALFSYFERGRIMPLEAWIEEVPRIVGLIVLDEMDINLQERVEKFLMGKLSVRMER